MASCWYGCMEQSDRRPQYETATKSRRERAMYGAERRRMRRRKRGGVDNRNRTGN